MSSDPIGPDSRPFVVRAGSGPGAIDRKRSKRKLHRCHQRQSQLLNLSKTLLRKTTGESMGVLPAKVGRNDPCVCGSELKFKKCCLGKADAGA